ncbi:hypothetical protein, partial [Streptomyces sp. NPDC051014]|uniref:hypothetical protein n=1 Tax=Streptomyces sp. NPDC051014 TaxID=3155751 RepID=UPI0033C2ABA1
TQVAADLAAVVVHPEVLGVWKELLGSLARTGPAHCVPVVWEGSNTTGAAAPGGDTPPAPQPPRLTRADREVLGAIHAGCVTTQRLERNFDLEHGSVRLRLSALGLRAGIPEKSARTILTRLVECYHTMSGVWSGLDLSELPTLQQIHEVAEDRKRKRPDAPAEKDTGTRGAIHAGDQTVADPSAVPTPRPAAGTTEHRKRSRWSYRDREVLGSIHAGDRTLDAIAKTLLTNTLGAQSRLAELGMRVGLVEVAPEKILETFMRDYPDQGMWTGLNLAALPTRDQIRVKAGRLAEARPEKPTPVDLDILGAIHAGDRTVGAILRTLAADRDRVVHQLSALAKRARIDPRPASEIIDKLVDDYPARGLWANVDRGSLPTRDQIRANVAARRNGPPVPR